MDTPTPTPAASVLIPTKNRKQLLLDTVTSVLRQTVPVEVIIIDDASTDGTADAVTQAFSGEPRVRLVRNEISGGPTLARNVGAKLATSEYLFTIDDDCLVPSPNTFAQTIAGFDHPRIAAVTIPFINVHQGPAVFYKAPANDDRYVSLMFFGGMVALRRSVYELLGGYRTAYFIYVEEPDLVARLLNAGYVVRLGDADPIDHLESPVRNRKRNLMLMTRNHVLYNWFNVPMPELLVRLPVAVSGTLLNATKVGRPDLALLGMVKGIGHVWRERGNRKPLTHTVHGLFRRNRFSTPRLSEVEPFLPALECGSSQTRTA